MNEHEHYQTVDLPFYRRHVAPLLPPEVLDFHAHTWTRAQLRAQPAQVAGGKYMVTASDYGVEALLRDLAAIFPDRPSAAVCFGNPTPAADLAATNEDTARAGRRQGLLPLMVLGRGQLSREEIRGRVQQGGFFGYKVFLNWYGDDYGRVAMEDMLGPDEMAVADELGLVVLWHVPRSGRLADPDVQRGLREYARRYPNARIVLAHCGRCYLPDEMLAAIGSIADLSNVYLDTSMVMDPTVLQIVFETIDSRRVLFATDLPVAAMRGRRVYVMDHWVDVVLEGYSASAYRLASDDIRATYMVYEIVLAIRRAAERAGLATEHARNVFHANGMAVLGHVMGGRQLAAARDAWLATPAAPKGERPSQRAT